MKTSNKNADSANVAKACFLTLKALHTAAQGKWN
jgi:hypothetical protein